jgi:predicted DNA-binding WGR domain protein
MEQIPLFPLEARLTRIDPARNTWRFYEMAVQRDLFGGAVLIRRWGRIGTAGLLRLKIRRGYRWAGAVS